MDIRMELTDHIATTLEQQHGDFELLFNAYMNNNSNNLKTLNSRFAAIAMKKTFLAFLKNLTGLRFAIVALLALAAGEAVNWFLPGTPAAGIMLVVFSVPYYMDSYNPMFSWGPKKPEFSVGRYYHVLMVAITFAAVWMVRFWDTEPLRHFVLSGYALLTAVAYTKYYTTKNLFTEYNAKYYAG
jgi:hypothetical protein